MIKWIGWHLMNLIGYRRVLYLPSEKGLGIADFYKAVEKAKQHFGVEG